MIIPYAIAPYSENQMSSSYLMPPSLQHWLGTDLMGRDIFSRIVIGTRYSFGVAVIAVAVASSAGLMLGSTSGYFGGLLDSTLSSFMDAIYSLPVLITALLFSVVLGPGILNTGLSVGLSMIPTCFRVIRSIVLSLRESTFITAETSLGASHSYIILFHIIPHCMSSLAVLATLTMGEALLTMSGLGFLGLGIPAPTPEWGTDVGASRQLITSGYWWPWVFPGLAIMLATLDLNLLAEGLSRVWAKESRH